MITLAQAPPSPAKPAPAANQGPGDNDGPMQGPPTGLWAGGRRARQRAAGATMDGKGLTRVIMAANTQIVKDEKLKADALKPGTKVIGTGRQIEGTGTATEPLRVAVETLELAGGMGSPFAFFGGGTSPLLRGRDAQVFRKVNYSGTIEFDAVVKSVDPLVLTDERGKPLPIVLSNDVEVHQRAQRPVPRGRHHGWRAADVDGRKDPGWPAQSQYDHRHGPGQRSRLQTGTIMAVSPGGVTLRPRLSRAI